MAERFVHQGALSEEATFPRKAKCIYSGKERMYDTPSKYWNEDRQMALNERFMKYDCDCKECTRKRDDRKRLIEALKRDNDEAGLRALGWETA